jgi:hypothetical protein
MQRASDVSQVVHGSERAPASSDTPAAQASCLQTPKHTHQVKYLQQPAIAAWYSGVTTIIPAPAQRLAQFANVLRLLALVFFALAKDDPVVARINRFRLRACFFGRSASAIAIRV